MSPAPLVFLDLESTGLDPDRHEPWEIAAIVRGRGSPVMDGEWLWRLKPDLTVADPAALRISRYYDRQAINGEGSAICIDWPGRAVHENPEDVTPGLVAEHLACLLAGAVLVGAVPSFDDGFLDRFLRRNGHCPTWSYRLVCVETLTAGHFGRLVGGLADCARELGVPVDPDVAHTALGDARLARDIYDVVMGEARGATLRPPVGVGGGGVSTTIHHGDGPGAYAAAYARQARAIRGLS